MFRVPGKQLLCCHADCFVDDAVQDRRSRSNESHEILRVPSGCGQTEVVEGDWVVECGRIVAEKGLFDLDGWMMYNTLMYMHVNDTTREGDIPYKSMLESVITPLAGKSISFRSTGGARLLTKDCVDATVVLRVIRDLSVLCEISSASDIAHFPKSLTGPHNFTTRGNHTQFGNVDLDDGTLGQHTQLRV